MIPLDSKKITGTPHLLVKKKKKNVNVDGDGDGDGDLII